jgi:hypothetical protein
MSLVSASAIDSHTHSERLGFEPFRMNTATEIVQVLRNES